MTCGQPAVSAVILNYKNPELTAKCVKIFVDSAIAAGLPTQVLVVDNSAPLTARRLRQLLPSEADLIENVHNMGFAKANNQGIAISRGKYILLLNNDCFVNSKCLRLGFDFLESSLQVGIWAPRLVAPDGGFQVSCAHEPSLKGLAAEYLLAFFWDGYRDAAEWTAPREVEALIGAFLLIRRQVFEWIGALDEEYFFTVEDMDYCRRVRKAGFSIVYDPRCSAIHMVNSSQEHKTPGGDSYLSDPYLHRYRALYFRKHRGVIGGAAARSIIWMGLTLRRGKRFLTTRSR